MQLPLCGIYVDRALQTGSRSEDRHLFIYSCVLDNWAGNKHNLATSVRSSNLVWQFIFLSFFSFWYIHKVDWLFCVKYYFVFIYPSILHLLSQVQNIVYNLNICIFLEYKPLFPGFHLNFPHCWLFWRYLSQKWGLF